MQDTCFDFLGGAAEAERFFFNLLISVVFVVVLTLEAKMKARSPLISFLVRVQISGLERVNSLRFQESP